jgi:hypothetical protein
MLDSELDGVAGRCHLLVRLQEEMSGTVRYKITASEVFEVQEQQQHIREVIENTRKVHFTWWHRAQQTNEAVSMLVVG